MKNYEQDIFFATLRMFELTVAELYITYAYVFFPESDRWIRLAEEEHSHATWFTSLRERSVGRGGVDRQTARAIRTANQAIDFVRRQIEDAKNGKVTLVQALIVALEVENLKFERFFPPFTFQDQQAEEVRHDVIREVREHRERFEIWLDRVRNKKFLAA